MPFRPRPSPSSTRQPSSDRTRRDQPVIADKVSFRTLPVTVPPTAPGGGRIVTPAGELAQVFSGQDFRFLAYLEFKANLSMPRGNHYHAVKTESLYVITGRLRAVYRDIETGETLTRTLSAGDLVTIKPGCAHTYFPEEYSQAIEVADTAYDPADTIPYAIERPDSE